MPSASTALEQGGVLAVVVAGLQRHEQGAVRRVHPALARVGQAVDLGVGLAAALVPALGHDLAVLHEHRAHAGVGGRGPAAALGELRRVAHEAGRAIRPIVELDKVHSCFGDHACGQFVRVGFGEIDAAHLGVDEHLGADEAGLGGAVDIRALDAHPVQGGLDDDVLFGVQAAADLVALAAGHAQLLAQANPRPRQWGVSEGGPVVACGQDAFVAHGDGPHLAARAGGAFGHQIGDPHEVVGPGHASGLVGHGRFHRAGRALGLNVKIRACAGSARVGKRLRGVRTPPRSRRCVFNLPGEERELPREGGHFGLDLAELGLVVQAAQGRPRSTGPRAPFRPP